MQKRLWVPGFKRLDRSRRAEPAVVVAILLTVPLKAGEPPFHSYITRRLQGEGVYREFRLKGTYEDEKAALGALLPSQRALVSENTVRFLFG